MANIIPSMNVFDGITIFKHMHTLAMLNNRVSYTQNKPQKFFLTFGVHFL